MKKLLAARGRLLPQFATHNALTVASVIEDAGGVEGFEFQRLYGMGEALYAALIAEQPEAACGVYAPVGGHRDLLAYLVRRLLENGANSSFVSVAADPRVPIEEILRRPQSRIGDAHHARNKNIPLPRDLYRPERQNSSGIEFGERASLDALLAEIRAAAPAAAEAAPLVDGIALPGIERAVASPIDGHSIGIVREGDEAIARAAMAAAAAGFPAWTATPCEERAAALERAADRLEQERGALIALLQNEGGKTLDDALAEVREAVDYCRYYAAQARTNLAPQPMPGPTGESNTLRYRGRGVFVCISPWNFPLAIFLGQVAAALVAGNAVVAKPAEQTPLIAARAVALLHAAGVPASALHLVPGNGEVGACLVADSRVAGVAFTGSTEVGHAINRVLAAKNGPIVPLIAETGGINPMIVDATALPEQVIDDVITSAFRSTGQRCSALRLLCLQEDVAEPMLDMLIGAMRELKVGDPRDVSTHLGPVIDAEAKKSLEDWIAKMEHAGRLRFRWNGEALPAAGTYVAPALIELDRARELQQEVFGPVLHVVRWRAEEIDALLDDIAANGTALTLGIHSRIDLTIERIAARLPHGNVYVNRNMIGAVVGTQPFGGTGLSGTGPKAGRPELSPALCDRAGRDRQHGGRGRQRQPAGPGRVNFLGYQDFNTIATISRYPGRRMADSVTRLYNAALACRHDDPSTSRTARLLRSGRSKMAKKLAEEAVEVVLDSMLGDRDAVVKESADLIYHLVVLWIASGIRPEDVWKEMDRRERLLGIAEKVPKKVFDDSARRKIVALESRRLRKRR